MYICIYKFLLYPPQKKEVIPFIEGLKTFKRAHTDTLTHAYIYIYIYIFKKNLIMIIMIINLFPSCYVFLIKSKTRKKKLTGILQILWIK